jgi:hypothetical protein
MIRQEKNLISTSNTIGIAFLRIYFRPVMILLKITVFLLILNPMLALSQSFQLVQSFPLARNTTVQPLNHEAIYLAPSAVSLIGMKKFSAVVASERRFQLKELTQVSALVGLPLQFVNIGLKLDRFGNEFMNETEAGILFAKNLSPVLSLGIEFNYYVRSFESIEKQSAIHGGLSLQLHLSDQMVTGVHIYNPTRVQVNKTGERLPYRYSMGMGYAPSEKIFLVTDLQKIEDQPVNIHTGVHYCIVPRVRVSMGITSAASSFYLAIGHRFRNLMVTLSAGFHPYLGFSPGVLLAYTGGE